MIIDFHVHCFADEIAERAVATLSEAAGLPPRSNGAVKAIRTSMKRAGVDRSVLLSIATKPQQTQKITQWAAAVQDDNIIAFGSIHPDYIDWESELHKLGREQFMRIASKHGYDRLLFATDSPWSDQAEEVEKLRNMMLPDDVTEAVLGGNAAGLLGLTC